MAFLKTLLDPLTVLLACFSIFSLPFCQDWSSMCSFISLQGFSCRWNFLKFSAYSRSSDLPLSVPTCFWHSWNLCLSWTFSIDWIKVLTSSIGISSVCATLSHYKVLSISRSSDSEVFLGRYPRLHINALNWVVVRCPSTLSMFLSPWFIWVSILFKRSLLLLSLDFDWEVRSLGWYCCSNFLLLSPMSNLVLKKELLLSIFWLLHCWYWLVGFDYILLLAAFLDLFSGKNYVLIIFAAFWDFFRPSPS